MPLVRQRYNPRTDEPYNQYLEAVRKYVFLAIARKQVKIKDLAEIMGRRPQTIMRLLERVTVAPQLPTVFNLLKATDFIMSIDEDSIEAPKVAAPKRKAITNGRVSRGNVVRGG